MQFFRIRTNDPIGRILVAIAVLITLFVGFELFRGVHRYHAPPAVPVAERQDVAGFLNASVDEDQLGLTGWAPPQSYIQIFDHDTLLASAVVDPHGKWSLAFTYEKHGHLLATLNATYQEKDKAAATLGSFTVFMPSDALEDATIWSQNNQATHLLFAPSNDESNLFLAYARRDDQGLIFSGRSDADTMVQLYADDELVGAGTATNGGYWTIASMLKPDHKASTLRFDEIDSKDGVLERRVYHIEWPDKEASGETPILRSDKEGWMLAVPAGDHKDIVAILKPGAGESALPETPIAGQVLPLSVPGQAKKTF
jgi:hypothetical protein